MNQVRQLVILTIMGMGLGAAWDVEAQDTNLNLTAIQAGAAKGDANAQYELGRCYEKGRGVPQDLARARSEERRVGKECEDLCRSRWSPYH